MDSPDQELWNRYLVMHDDYKCIKVIDYLRMQEGMTLEQSIIKMEDFFKIWKVQLKKFHEEVEKLLL